MAKMGFSPSSGAVFPKRSSCLRARGISELAADAMSMTSGRLFSQSRDTWHEAQNPRVRRRLVETAADGSSAANGRASNVNHRVGDWPICTKAALTRDYLVRPVAASRTLLCAAAAASRAMPTRPRASRFRAKISCNAFAKMHNAAPVCVGILRECSPAALRLPCTSQPQLVAPSSQTKCQLRSSPAWPPRPRRHCSSLLQSAAGPPCLRVVRFRNGGLRETHELALCRENADGTWQWGVGLTRVPAPPPMGDGRIHLRFEVGPARLLKRS